MAIRKLIEPQRCPLFCWRTDINNNKCIDLINWKQMFWNFRLSIYLCHECILFFLYSHSIIRFHSINQSCRFFLSLVKIDTKSNDFISVHSKANEINDCEDEKSESEREKSNRIFSKASSRDESRCAIVCCEIRLVASFACVNIDGCLEKVTQKIYAQQTVSNKVQIIK